MRPTQKSSILSAIGRTRRGERTPLTSRGSRVSYKFVRVAGDTSASTTAFTLLELIVVLAVIIILVAVVLGAAGYVQKKGARSRAETEIAALSAALESYKADNAIYPTTTNTNSLYPRTATDVTTYSAASLDLYKALSGDTDGDRIVDAGRSYFAFTPAQLAPSAQGQPVQFIRDPFGNSYGYSTAANPTANPSPSPSPSPAGYNPTFDLWSTGGYTPPSATPTPTPQDFWIKNW